MKQKDILLVVVMVFISAILSWFISNAVFAAPENRQTEVEVVTPISTELPEADKRFFNKDSIDPTRTITIEQNANPDPFKESNQ